MAPLRIYGDTSVIGGCFDQEFAVASLRFFEAVRAGRVVLSISDLVLTELHDAPNPVRRLLSSLPDPGIERITLTAEVVALRDAYLSAGIVGPRWMDDAGHVAAATVGEADAIVSWNFRHIVRLDKMKAYNAVNRSRGYADLTIITPLEVAPDAP